MVYSARPFPVLQIPRDRVTEAGLKVVGRCPAEVALDFAGVDGIALIVTLAIINIGDEVFV